MGQDLVKFSGATGVIESNESGAMTAATANQKRLLALLSDGANPETSRFYIPPPSHADTAQEFVPTNGMPYSSTVDRSVDPKACWTGFTFGIACAAAVGFAFFLSFATVVTPQPSVAALVPLEVERDDTTRGSLQSVVGGAAKALSRLNVHVEQETQPSIWQQLHRFHASAGKFSQPGILTASTAFSQEQQQPIQATERQAAIREAKRQPVIAQGERQAPPMVQIKYAAPLAPRLINVGDEQENDLRANSPPNAIESRREPIVLESKPMTTTGHAAPIEATEQPATDTNIVEARVVTTEARVMGQSDVNGLSEQTTVESAAFSPPLPLRRPALVTASRGTNVVKSSLTPTARTKVNLGRSNAKRRIARSKKWRRAEASSIGRLSQQKRNKQFIGWFGAQKTPSWAYDVFRTPHEAAN